MKKCCKKISKKRMTKNVLAMTAIGGIVVAAALEKSLYDVKKIASSRREVNDRVFTRFSEHYKYVDNDHEFNGANVGAAFGSLRLDLGKVKLHEDVVVEVGALMSAVTIIVPRDVNVVMECKLLAGASTLMKDPLPDRPTIFIRGFCRMGVVLVLESNLETAQEISERTAATSAQEEKQLESEEKQTKKEEHPESEEKQPEKESKITFQTLEEPAGKEKLSKETVSEIIEKISKDNANETGK